MARRVLGGFLGWLRDGVETVVLSVVPDNEASPALVRRVGFARTGERQDEEDGLELPFERSLEPPLPCPPAGAPATW